MNNQFELGTPLNIQWHFKRPDGENYSLAGQQPTLYCINARGRFMVPSVVMNAEGGYLSFTLDRRMQVCSGEYSFLLQLRQNGVRANDVIYRDAVTLVRTGTAMSTQEAADNNVPPTIQLFTVGEFNLYTPTAPVGGADGYWYFNGQRILDETDTEVAAYFSLKFTREGENRGRITIYKGNADVDVEPVVVDTFDAVKVALDTVDYEMDPDNDGEEQGDHESWAHKVEVTWQDNETTRQSQESTRQSNETTRKNNEGIGTTDAECAAGSRRKNESIRVANESTRQSQEGTRQSNEATRGQKETARQKAEGQLGSSDPDYDTSRIKNELDRQEAESRRQTNEGIGATDAECAAGSRRKNESIRQTNEATRQAQEGSATDEPSASGSRWARYKYNEGTDAGSEAGDASRWGKFKEQEGTLDSSEADDGSRWGQYKEEEGTEDSSYTEHSRWGNYRAAEITRDNDYSEAEGSADGSTSGDGSRWGSYKLQEGANTDDASASGSRWARYKKAENDRETAYGTAEGSATDSPSASGSRWARFNKAQADRDQAIAPAIGIYDCDTAAATADKTVSASDYILASGGAIKIKFQYANSAASPTLNINSQGAKAIVFNGAVASASNTWGAGEVVEFYYDPSYNSNAGGYIGRSTVVSVSQNTLTIGGEDKGELAGQLIESSEWVWVVTLKEKQVLFGFNKKDGSPYFGYGCPPQVIDYVQKELAALSLDEYEDIVTFLGNLIHGNTLSVLLNGKVDKVNGKGLIDSDVAESIEYIESSEWGIVFTDGANKVIGGARKKDGRVFFFGGIEGVPTNEDLDKLAKAIQDKVDKVEGKSLIDADIAESIQYVEDVEWAQLELDAKKKIIRGTTKEGVEVDYCKEGNFKKRTSHQRLMGAIVWDGWTPSATGDSPDIGEPISNEQYQASELYDPEYPDWREYIKHTTGVYPPTGTSWASFMYTRPDIQPSREPMNTYELDGQSVSLGWYNTGYISNGELHDTVKVEAQIDMAAKYGIDFFAISLAVNNDMFNVDGTINESVLMASATNNFAFQFLAASNNWKMRFCILTYFGYLSDAKKAYTLITYLKSKFVSHPQYLFVDGSPVILIYDENRAVVNYSNCRIGGIRLYSQNRNDFDGKWEYLQSAIERDDSNYNKYVHRNILNQESDMTTIPQIYNVACGFDNRSRYGYKTGIAAGRYYVNKPDAEEWFVALCNTIDLAESRCSGDAVVLIYAWDEFVEGGWLMPTQAEIDSGENYYKLEQIKKAKDYWLKY